MENNALEPVILQKVSKKPVKRSVESTVIKPKNEAVYFNTCTVSEKRKSFCVYMLHESEPTELIQSNLSKEEAIKLVFDLNTEKGVKAVRRVFSVD